MQNRITLQDIETCKNQICLIESNRESATRVSRLIDVDVDGTTPLTLTFEDKTGFRWDIPYDNLVKLQPFHEFRQTLKTPQANPSMTTEFADLMYKRVEVYVDFKEDPVEGVLVEYSESIVIIETDSGRRQIIKNRSVKSIEGPIE